MQKQTGSSDNVSSETFDELAASYQLGICNVTKLRDILAFNSVQIQTT